LTYTKAPQGSNLKHCCHKVGNNPTVLNENGDKISLTINPEDEVYLRGVYYKGRIEVNIAGKWDKGFSEPMWVISNLPPEEAIEIYRLRMKIEQSFRDMKDLLNIYKIMNQKQENMEKMLSMVLLSYSIGLLIGETIRESVYTEKKRKLYSGLHILLKRKVNIFGATLKTIINSAFLAFSNIVWGNVRTYV
jgi:transposase